MKDLFPILRADSSKDFYAGLESYMDNVVSTVSNLKETIEHYCNEDTDLILESANKVISEEQNADDKRRELEKILYKGVLIPFGREDKYELIERIDDVADKAEIIVRLAKFERPKIPKKIKKDLKKLASLVELTAVILRSAVINLNKDLDMAIKEASKVEIHRETVREFEFKLLETLFKGKSNGINLLILKELITLVGQVADKAEDAADRVISIAVKYQS